MLSSKVLYCKDSNKLALSQVEVGAVVHNSVLEPVANRGVV